MHLRTLLSTLSLATVSLSQLLTQPSDLVALLSPSDPSNTVATTGDVILGQTISLPLFDLTLLTNTTHALVTFNVSRAIGAIGWLSVGFGTRMHDSAIVVLWPPEDLSKYNWTISHRSTGGYSEPAQTRSLDTSTGTPFTLVPELISTVTISEPRQRTKHYTTVSFIRELELPADQTLFKSAAYLNVSRTATDQKVIWAFSRTRPNGADEAATMEMHDPGQFGWEEMDMTTVVSGVKLEEVEGEQGWTKYDLVVLAHAGIGMILYLLVAPAAILVKRLGHAWPRAYAVHSTLLGAIVIPGTFALAALGMLASYLGYSTDFTAHKFIGFLIVLLVLFQLGAGYWSHKTHNPASTTRSWLSVSHMLIGISTLVLSWVQIRLGWGEWQGRTRPHAVSIIYTVFILVFVTAYAASMTFLVTRRRRDGHSWRAAILGRTPSPIPSSNAPPTIVSPKPWVDKVLDRWVDGDQDAKPVVPPEEAGAKGDLSAWK
ncbi:hypothetical protein RQP46_011008 [Phenoliferia psychrophenolica]